MVNKSHYIFSQLTKTMTVKMGYFIPMQDEVISVPLINLLNKLEITSFLSTGECIFMICTLDEGVCNFLWNCRQSARHKCWMLDIIPSQMVLVNDMFHISLHSFTHKFKCVKNDWVLLLFYFVQGSFTLLPHSKWKEK